MRAKLIELRRWVRVPLALTLLTSAGCSEKTPTSIDDSQLPGEPLTLRIRLPWEEFGSNLEVVGGYGRPQQLLQAVLAKSFGGTLEARTLVQWGDYPQSASVIDSTGTTLTDSDIAFIGGYVVAFFDTIASTNTEPVTLGLGQLEEEWDPVSATWTSAVDTVGDQRDWSEVGGGAVLPLVTGEWNPAAGDSAQLFVDSAVVAGWGDPDAPVRAARLELQTDGERLIINGLSLRLLGKSTIAPDTTLVLTVATERATFVYDPPAQPPVGGMRVGGAPSWRTILDVAVPAELTGPPELCATVGCPFALQPRHVSYAALGLRTRQTETAFQPTDSTVLDVRAVLSRPSLPKSPLGTSLVAGGLGTRVGPEGFGAQDGQLIEIPITSFVQNFLSGPDASGRPPSNTLALLTLSEPGTFWYTSFFGPGGPNEPVLDLILTISQPLQLK